MSLSNHPQILLIFIFAMLGMQITWAITFSVAGFHLVQVSAIGFGKTTPSQV